MIFRGEDNCKICAHYTQNQTCKAFPNGIPAPLWSGENPHRESYPGDQGIFYRQKPRSFPDAEVFLNLGKGD